MFAALLEVTEAQDEGPASRQTWDRRGTQMLRLPVSAERWRHGGHIISWVGEGAARTAPRLAALTGTEFLPPSRTVCSACRHGLPQWQLDIKAHM